MKKTLCILALALSITAQPALADEKRITLDVRNMTCALCPFTVSTAIKSVKGVHNVDVDFDAKTATVIFDDSITNADTVAQASTHAGYPAKQRM
ncbi:MAG: cation transporter [Magnetovibrio sp.]|nr:cation transporter [Magnetovibrio sp.]